MDPANSWPTPKCQVWAWSGHASRTWHPGTLLSAEGAYVGSGPGRFCRQIALRSVRHHSCKHRIVHDGMFRFNACEMFYWNPAHVQACASQTWHTRADVNPVKSIWHLPKCLHSWAFQKPDDMTKHNHACMHANKLRYGKSRCHGQSPRTPIMAIYMVCVEPLLKVTWAQGSKISMIMHEYRDIA